jgi:hypothetical protein
MHTIHAHYYNTAPHTTRHMSIPCHTIPHNSLHAINLCNIIELNYTLHTLYTYTHYTTHTLDRPTLCAAPHHTTPHDTSTPLHTTLHTLLPTSTIPYYLKKRIYLSRLSIFIMLKILDYLNDYIIKLNYLIFPIYSSLTNPYTHHNHTLHLIHMISSIFYPLYLPYSLCSYTSYTRTLYKYKL